MVLFYINQPELNVLKQQVISWEVIVPVSLRSSVSKKQNKCELFSAFLSSETSIVFQLYWSWTSWFSIDLQKLVFKLDLVCMCKRQCRRSCSKLLMKTCLPWEFIYWFLYNLNMLSSSSHWALPCSAVSFTVRTRMLTAAASFSEHSSGCR